MWNKILYEPYVKKSDMYELKWLHWKMASQINSFLLYKILIWILKYQKRPRPIKSFNIYILYYAARRYANSKLFAFKSELQLSQIQTKS